MAEPDNAPKLDDLLGLPPDKLRLAIDVLGMMREGLFPDAGWKEFDREMDSYTAKLQARFQRALDLREEADHG